MTDHFEHTETTTTTTTEELLEEVPMCRERFIQELAIVMASSMTSATEDEIIVWRAFDIANSIERRLKEEE